MTAHLPNPVPMPFAPQSVLARAETADARSDSHIITLCTAFHPERLRAEAFVEAAFAKAYDGIIRHHYPILMSVRDRSDTILAVAGFRFAALEPLFLEAYLDRSVEATLAQHEQSAVRRHQIAEIGNLAASDQAQARGAAIFLFKALSEHLASKGLTYAVATATAPLRRLFSRVAFEISEIAQAHPERLNNAADWGRYYDHDPRVLFGRISRCAAPLKEVRLPDLYARLHMAATRKGE
ncbi:thermostable hemolysin [Asticcacaulis sp. DXS10W]|uniref:Thermostable hemolysin n=1 Tax=Asticcacaulis currens TaxID=2984210 RepID=A0ABT5IER0_9CAUL|nr:thermostable hemolysin [Asticcacaulis currens]MDC7694345.1 thermostable hemolysin [Asticcacaulis currens]